MTSPEDVDLAIGAGVDAVGFVGAGPTSSRSLNERVIAALIARVPPPVATFVLTTETTADAVARQVLATGANTVQLLALLDHRESARLGELLPATRRVQVIHVEGPGAVQLIDRYPPHVHGNPSATGVFHRA